MVQVIINELPIKEAESKERLVLVDIIKNAATPQAVQKVKEISYDALTPDQKAVYEAFENMIETLANE